MSKTVDKKKKLGEMFALSRAAVGMTQEYMAMEMEVSKKTIHDWELGISSPNFYKTIEWFKVLGLNPMTYFYGVLYPDVFSFPVEKPKEGDLNTQLKNLLIGLDDDTKRQLIYVLQGTHGSSPLAEIQLMCAHCHTTMRSRVLTAHNVMTSYEMDRDLNCLVDPDRAQPNMDLLNAATLQGKKAVAMKQQGYHIEG